MKWAGEDYHFQKGILPFLLILGVLILAARLFFLQIIKGEDYRSLAEGNRVKKEIIHAPRGIIYDRNGYPLVRNIPGFRIKEDNGKLKILSREEALAIQVKGGQDLEIDSLREYLYPEEFAHVLGYLGEGEADELIGKSGIEEENEEILAGVDGARLIEVDARGWELRVLGEIKARSGQDLKTSLDLSLQKKAFQAMQDVERGAIVVSDPRNGEILALVSKPSFNPNLFTLGESSASGEKAEKILIDKNYPLFNRAISGTYPPGSTFKIITAAAGLENGLIDEKTQIEDVGILRIGNFSFPNWYFMQYGKLEGLLDIVGAIKRSNDIFFYKVAEMVGLERLGEMARKFGLGQTLGIDLQGEAAGLFPSEEWKIKNIGDKWYLGDTYHLGIGQGYLLVTPLQMNAWTAVIANGGTVYRPHLVKSSASAKASADKQNFLKPESINLIKEGMREACMSGGTGWPLFNFKVKDREIQTACKTGTAEFGDPKDRTHAWFTVFAPLEDPQIVVTVLVEGGGEGSNVAAPIAKQVLEEWFLR